MAPLHETDDLLRCSFCGKKQAQVKKLISGPGVYICDECVDLCCEVLEDEGVMYGGQCMWPPDPERFFRDWTTWLATQPNERIREAKRLLDLLVFQLDELLESPK